MPIQFNKLQAIYRTLAQSVQTGLNASLTPEDCAELLKAFTLLNMQRTAQTKGKAPLDRIVEGVAEFARGVVDDLTADLSPGKRRRK